MSGQSALVDGRGAAAAMLRETRRRRHNETRAETRRRRAARPAGMDKAAARSAERDWRRGVLATARERRRQAAEDELEGRKLRTALRRAQRQTERDTRPIKFHTAFEPGSARIGGDASLLRELFFEHISRGFNSGRTRTNQKAAKTNSARTRKWSKGEMVAKLRYIMRAEALEDVPGNVISTMGDDIDEILACGEAIEELERLGPRNGGVYKHDVIGLPHQLSGEQRAELLAELVEPIRRLGLPGCAVLHRPDPEGDPRNFHAHIIVSHRPMTRIDAYRWNFASGKLTWLDTPQGLRLQRRLIARTFNRVLAKAGKDVRWTAKSRSSRGLPTPGNNKTGAEATRAERQLAKAEKKLVAANSEVAEIERHIHRIDALEDVSDRLYLAFERHGEALRKREGAAKSTAEVEARLSEPANAEPAGAETHAEPIAALQEPSDRFDVDVERRQDAPREQEPAGMPPAEAETLIGEPASVEIPHIESRVEPVGALVQPSDRLDVTVERQRQGDAAATSKVAEAFVREAANARGLREEAGDTPPGYEHDGGSSAAATKKDNGKNPRSAVNPPSPVDPSALRLAEAAAARAEIEEDHRRRQQMRRRIYAFDDRVCQQITRRRLSVNDADAFDRLRRYVWRLHAEELYTQPHWTGEFHVFHSTDRSLLRDIELLAQSPGGHFYIRSLVKELEPPTDAQQRLPYMLIGQTPVEPTRPARRWRSAHRGKGSGMG